MPENETENVLEDFVLRPDADLKQISKDIKDYFGNTAPYPVNPIINDSYLFYTQLDLNGLNDRCGILINLRTSEINLEHIDNAAKDFYDVLKPYLIKKSKVN